MAMNVPGVFSLSIVAVAIFSDPVKTARLTGSTLLEMNRPEASPQKMRMESLGDHQMDILSS